MKKRVRIGSRESQLAMWQAKYIAEQIERANPYIEVEIVAMKTTGDRILDRNLDQIGGKGLFVKELDIALMEKRTDLSVHSLKDMPMEINGELPVVAYSRREDPRDVLICRKGIRWENIRSIGTSSPRRRVQLVQMFPNSIYMGMRGNIQTRLRKLQEGQCDATVLAMAGLKRLGIDRYMEKIFEPDELLPAAGQGILAVQGRAGENYDYLECVEDREGRTAAYAERAFVCMLGGGCHSPVAAYASIKGEQIRLKGLYYHEKTGECITGVLEGNTSDAEAIGRKLALQMKERSVFCD